MSSSEGDVNININESCLNLLQYLASARNARIPPFASKPCGNSDDDPSDNSSTSIVNVRGPVVFREAPSINNMIECTNPLILQCALELRSAVLLFQTQQNSSVLNHGYPIYKSLQLSHQSNDLHNVLSYLRSSLQNNLSSGHFSHIRPLMANVESRSQINHHRFTRYRLTNDPTQSGTLSHVDGPNDNHTLSLPMTNTTTTPENFRPINLDSTSAQDQIIQTSHNVPLKQHPLCLRMATITMADNNSCNHSWSGKHFKSSLVSWTTNTTQQPIVCPTNNITTIAHRKIGRVRRYNSQTKSYNSWEDICIPSSSNDDYSSNGSNEFSINLSRGGRLRFNPNLLPPAKRKKLSKAMHNCKLFRQYSFNKVFHEPRSHVLLSSRIRSNNQDLKSSRSCNDIDDGGTIQPGYMYHGIKMRALPLDLVPEVANYAEELARHYKLPDNQWDIGVDLIVYKDGEDSIGWHADDTQGESIVLCVVVESPGEPRPLLIRPKRKFKKLSDGDEEIELLVGEGDSYDMDGYMQVGYEHSLPKKKKMKSHRFVLIFRHGCVASVPEDSGETVVEMAQRLSSKKDNSRTHILPRPLLQKEWDLIPLLSQLRVKLPTVSFGHPMDDVAEGDDCLGRRFLFSVSAHRSDQKGVNGNVLKGCDSIVVSRQSPMYREEDGLSWFMYTSSRKQGGGALCFSYRCKSPVRVFRSSDLDGSFAPPLRDFNLTSYRYDGLYYVTSMWDAKGDRTESDIPVGGTQYTFMFDRAKTRPTSCLDINSNEQRAFNLIDSNDLWKKIQYSQGRDQPLELVSFRPNYSTLCKLPNDVFDNNTSSLVPVACNAAIEGGSATSRSVVLAALKNAIGMSVERGKFTNKDRNTLSAQNIQTISPPECFHEAAIVTKPALSFQHTFNYATAPARPCLHAFVHQYRNEFIPKYPSNPTQRLEHHDHQTNTTKQHIMYSSASVTEPKGNKSTKTAESKNGDKSCESPKKCRLNKSWQYHYSQLKQYYDQHSHSRVPSKYPLNQRLPFWVKEQRYQYGLIKKGKGSSLTKEKIALLEEVGCVWGVKNRTTEGAKASNKLRDKNNAGTFLGETKHSAKKKLGIISEDANCPPCFGDKKKRRLRGPNDAAQIGVKIFVDNSTNSSVNKASKLYDKSAWQCRYSQQKRYYDQHGHSKVPTNYHDNPELGMWVRSQRCENELRQNGKASSLTKENINLLNEVEIAQQKPSKTSGSYNCIQKMTGENASGISLNETAYSAPESPVNPTNEYSITRDTQLFQRLKAFFAHHSSNDYKNVRHIQVTHGASREADVFAAKLSSAILRNANKVRHPIRTVSSRKNVVGNKKQKQANKSTLHVLKTGAHRVPLQHKHTRHITPRFESIVGEHTQRLNPPLEASHPVRRRGSRIKTLRVTVIIPIPMQEQKVCRHDDVSKANCAGSGTKNSNVTGAGYKHNNRNAACVERKKGKFEERSTVALQNHKKRRSLRLLRKY